MKFNSMGAMMFDDVYELNYNLLNEMSISLLPDGSLMYHNDETGNKNLLQMEGKKILASVDPNNIHYASQLEVTFDVLDNIKLVMFLFGFYLDRKQEEGMPFLAYFSEERIDLYKAKSRKLDNLEIKKTGLTVKLNSAESVTSEYYHNRCLKFIDMIFRLDEDLVDLSNFDIIDFEAEEEIALNGDKRRR